MCRLPAYFFRKHTVLLVVSTILPFKNRSMRLISEINLILIVRFRDFRWKLLHHPILTSWNKIFDHLSQKFEKCHLKTKPFPFEQYLPTSHLPEDTFCQLVISITCLYTKRWNNYKSKSFYYDIINKKRWCILHDK